ncbi:GIY-YIG nuclease family protein [candidate division TA06 bacterium]|nr:GIY-YIG nuclease family protein [candidate division TA06 bacterium]
MYYVYLIRSRTTGKTYTGQTSDMEKRLAYHNDPANRLTLYTKRNQGPWLLVYSEQYASRQEAVKRERFLKSGKGRTFIKNKIESGC